MENKILRFTMRDLTEKSSKKLIKLNDESINYGLVLSENDVNNIMKHTNETLTKIGRIETSTSSLEKIIEIVCCNGYDGLHDVPCSDHRYRPCNPCQHAE